MNSGSLHDDIRSIAKELTLKERLRFLSSAWIFIVTARLSARFGDVMIEYANIAATRADQRLINAPPSVDEPKPKVSPMPFLKENRRHKTIH